MSDTPQKAILYLLNRINKEPALAWYFVATEAHSRLMEAAAELTGEQLAQIKAFYGNPKTADPAKGEFSLKPAMASVVDMRDVEEHLEVTTCEQRMQLFHFIRTRFCLRCGGVKGASVYCGCNIGRRPK